MYKIEYHTTEQLGTTERKCIFFNDLNDAIKVAEEIRKTIGIIVAITEIKK